MEKVGAAVVPEFKCAVRRQGDFGPACGRRAADSARFGSGLLRQVDWDTDPKPVLFLFATVSLPHSLGPTVPLTAETVHWQQPASQCPGT